MDDFEGRMARFMAATAGGFAILIGLLAAGAAACRWAVRPEGGSR